MTDYKRFFSLAQGDAAIQPYPYQEALGTGEWPDVLNIPTGMGKTAAVILAWAFKRQRRDPDTPRRLVYCLPMRVLVEQTFVETVHWLHALGLLAGSVDLDDHGKPLANSYKPPLQGEEKKEGITVHLLMGGEDQESWDLHPEQNVILIGTQDMLLSRALMRGYGMSRYQWPMHFALLQNDAFWVLDEVQLMGPALATTCQLEAFRRDFPLAKPSRTLWVSATLDPTWLGTVDFRSHLNTLTINSLQQTDLAHPPVQQRINAPKRLQPARTQLTSDNAKQKAADYAADLASEVTDAHQDGTNSLVVVNNVGFGPVSTDTYERSHNGPKECPCPSEEDSVPSSSAKRLN